MAPTDLIAFWKDSATDDWESAEALFAAKKYHQALFFCHLALEKLLKGLVYAKTSQHPLPIHNLTKLLQQAKLPLDNHREEQLNEITGWNINARYDDYKHRFYRKASKQFTAKWLQITRGLFSWLKNQY